MLTIATNAHFVTLLRSVSQAELHLSLFPLRPSGDGRVRLIRQVNPFQWLLGREPPVLQSLAHRSQQYSPIQTQPDQRLNRLAGSKRRTQWY